MFLWRVNFSLAKKRQEKGSTFPVALLCLLHISFSTTPQAALSLNTKLPPHSFKRFGLFPLTTPVATLMSWRLLMNPLTPLPPILVSNAISFRIPKSNRLGLPISSSSFHFFFQVLTVVLRKEYFGYLVANFLIAKAVPKSLAYRPTSFLIFAGISTLHFFGELVCLLHLLFIIWIPSVSSLLILFFFLKLKAIHKLEVSNTHSSIDENLHIRIPFRRLLCSPPTLLYNTFL